MGQYILASLSHRLTVPKEDLEKHSINKDMLIATINKEVDVSCYDISEFEDYYEFKAKEEIFNPKDLAGFIKEQCDLFKSSKSDVIFDKVSTLTSYEDIINLAEDKWYANFQEHKSRYILRHSHWKNFNVDVEGIVFFMEGKADLECYEKLFEYIKALIKKSSNYKMSAMVQLFLE